MCPPGMVSGVIPSRSCATRRWNAAGNMRSSRPEITRDRNVGQALEGPRLTERRARLVGIELERLLDQLVREVVVVDDAVVLELGGVEAELLRRTPAAPAP